MNCSQGKKSTSGSKNTGEDGSQLEKKNLVRSFLESSFRACTRDCIEVDIESLKEFFEADEGASHALSAALNFKKFYFLTAPKSTWKFWACCYCALRFAHSIPHGRHIMDDHLDQPSKDMVNFLQDFTSNFPREWCKNILDGCWKPIHVSTAALVTDGTVPDLDASLPCADTEREILLESISMLFKFLLSSGFLHASHIKAMLDYAMAGISSSSEVLKMNGMDGNSMMLFRCLEVPQLKHVLHFLNNLARSCKVGLHAKENSSTNVDNDDDKFLDPTDKNLRMILDDSQSSILIYVEIFFILSDNGSDDVSYNLDSASVISWLYDDQLTVEDAVKVWNQSGCARHAQCVKIIEDLKVKRKELVVIQRLNNHWLRYKNALQNLVIIQSFEKERETADHTIQSFKKNLEAWKEQLSEDATEVFTRAVTEILKQAEDMTASGNWDDNFITKALAKAKEDLIMKFHLNAAKVQKNFLDGGQLHQRLATVSCFDYLTFVIPMVKSFLRAKWESEARKAQEQAIEASQRASVCTSPWTK